MTACILLAWLKLLALDGDLAKAEPKKLPRPARRRPPRARQAAAMAENRRILALGQSGHRRLEADQRPSASALTSTNPSRRARKENPGTAEPRPVSRARSHTRTLNPAPGHSPPPRRRQPSTPMKDQG
jgi:hypothetical protein